MRLAELFEALRAPVHRNVDRTLTVLPGLVQYAREFELKTPLSSCLFIQALHTMAAVSGIPANAIASQLKIRVPDETGHTLEEIFNLVHETPIKYQGKRYKFTLGVDTYPNIDRALEAVSEGQPVVAIIHVFEDLQKALFDLESDYKFTRGALTKGIVLPPDMRPIRYSGHLYHTLLIIGYDSAHDHVIMRETRAKYGFGGYAKVPKSLLKKYPKLVRKYLGVTVEKLDEVK